MMKTKHPTRRDWHRAFDIAEREERKKKKMTRERVVERITSAFGCEDSEFSTNKAESEQVMADMRECLTWVQSIRQHR